MKPTRLLDDLAKRDRIALYIRNKRAALRLDIRLIAQSTIWSGA